MNIASFNPKSVLYLACILAVLMPPISMAQQSTQQTGDAIPAVDSSVHADVQELQSQPSPSPDAFVTKLPPAVPSLSHWGPSRVSSPSHCAPEQPTSTTPALHQSQPASADAQSPSQPSTLEAPKSSNPSPKTAKAHRLGETPNPRLKNTLDNTSSTTVNPSEQQSPFRNARPFGSRTSASSALASYQPTKSESAARASKIKRIKRTKKKLQEQAKPRPGQSSAETNSTPGSPASTQKTPAPLP